MSRTYSFLSVLAVVALLFSCTSASQHAAEVQQGIEGDRLSVGTVQREIRHGMSGAEVAQALGSPNIVSTDEKGREVWIYDKIATDTAYSTSRGGVGALILGVVTGGGALGGLGSGSAEYGAGAASTSQRTLTVIIKFDEQGKVRDFAYHASRF